MAETPVVAPYNSCMGCLKGDVSTGFALEGEAEWIMVTMHKLAGITQDQAIATFHVMAEEMGCDPGMVPSGRVTVLVRVCRTCARKTGATVHELADEEVAGYAQPE
jgi:hypothetical protein